MAMVAITIRGVTLPRARNGEWIWLRVHTEGVQMRVQEPHAVDYCVGKMPLPPSAFGNIPSFRLQTSGETVVRLEVWTAAVADGAFMQYVGACWIDTKAWPQGESHERWYEVNQSRMRKKTAWTENQRSSSAYRITAPDDARAGMFVLVAAMFVQHNQTTPPSEEALVETEEQNGFQFIVPHNMIRQRALLRRLSIHEVVHQSQIGVLEELLATTLYSKLVDDSVTSNNDQGLLKALMLLQLSCQYAMHTISELQRSSRELETRLDSHDRRVRRLRGSKTKLEERRRTLARELDVLGSALDGMKMMLPELDPASVEKDEG